MPANFCMRLLSLAGTVERWNMRLAIRPETPRTLAASPFHKLAVQFLSLQRTCLETTSRHSCST